MPPYTPVPILNGCKRLDRGFPFTGYYKGLSRRVKQGGQACYNTLSIPCDFGKAENAHAVKVFGTPKNQIPTGSNQTPTVCNQIPTAPLSENGY